MQDRSGLQGAAPPRSGALRPLDGGGIKTSRASLFGGIAVAIGVFVLWTAIARELAATGPLPLALGAVVGALIGLWIWKADL
ncbi:hypothetical protein JYK14_26285 [Siccirubricoccus sp. KC 17139]|uniref:Uncharacterized protein n=1 Tax=Siccirubricoccus soli TaxID=2899147 RepID=A0ABT1DCJ4_9PROT|nr:hypothetical protein [Siccirubricoccus soli]MCO6419649.1 hypothetical protein [Siccirubricoccus soli]MCP2685784.1 hypothetical protein [Siccirubricoccus soli]